MLNRTLYFYLVFLVVYFRLFPFPQAFGQFKDWLLLEVALILACPIVFFLLLGDLGPHTTKRYILPRDGSIAWFST